MSSAAYASDGGSSTESEDEAAAYLEFNVKSEPSATTATAVEVASPLSAEPVVKSEAEVVESHVTPHDGEDANLELKAEVKPEVKTELPGTDNATTTTTTTTDRPTTDRVGRAPDLLGLWLPTPHRAPS